MKKFFKDMHDKSPFTKKDNNSDHENDQHDQTPNQQTQVEEPQNQPIPPPAPPADQGEGQPEYSAPGYPTGTANDVPYAQGDGNNQDQGPSYGQGPNPQQDENYDANDPENQTEGQDGGKKPNFFKQKLDEGKQKMQETNQKIKENAENAKKRFTNFLHIDFGEPDPKYDELWGDPKFFEEQTFAEHFIRNRKWVDVFWTVFFWINFVVAIVLFALSDPAQKSENFNYDGTEIPTDHVALVSAISAFLGVAMVIILMIVLWFLPGFFIKFSLAFGIVAIAIALALNLGVNKGVAAAFTAIAAFFSLIFMFKWCGNIQFSSCVLKSAVLVAHKYPGTYFFSLVMVVLEAAVSFLFSYGSMASFYHNISPYVYIYVIYAYYYISKTISNFAYTVVSGVACCWYFLNETEFLPKNPFWVSFIHMIGPTFGPISLAGALQALADTIDNFCDSSSANPLFCCIKCCCMCFKCLISFILKKICRFALIYCGMFGVEAKEAVKRWAKQKSKKMVKQCVVSTIIQATFNTYSWIAGTLGGALCSYVAYKKYGEGSSEYVFATTMGALFAKSIIIMWSEPIMTMSDSLFVGFGEAPQRLETGAHEIMELFDEKSKKLFQEEIDKDLGRDTGGCCSCFASNKAAGLDADEENPDDEKEKQKKKKNGDGGCGCC